MQETFTKWSKGFAKDEKLAQAQKMTWGNWYDLEDFKKTVNSIKDKSIQRKFNDQPPSTAVLNDISKEYLKYSSIISQIEQALNWDCTKNSESYKKYLYNMKDKLTIKMHGIDNITNDQLLEIENQLLRGQHDFFLNHNDQIYEELADWDNKICPEQGKYLAMYDEIPNYFVW